MEKPISLLGFGLELQVLYESPISMTRDLSFFSANEGGHRRYDRGREEMKQMPLAGAGGDTVS